MKIVDYLSQEWNDEISLYSGIGFSEIVVIIKGNSVEKIFGMIERLRKLTFREIFRGFRFPKPQRKFNRELPIFSDTTTFSLISYNEVLDAENYIKLKGNILPFMEISCHPSCEKEIVTSLGKDARSILGKEDLFVYWEGPQKLEEFIERLVEFRKRWGSRNGLYSTSTRLLSEKFVKPQKKIKEVEVLSSNIIAQLKLDIFREVLTKGDRFLMNNLQDFLARLNSCFSNVKIAHFFNDMTFFVLHLESLLHQYIKRINSGDYLEKHRTEGDIVALINCANLGFCQRLTGIEIGESPALFLPSTFSGGITRMLGSTSVIPEFIYREINEFESPPNLWPGFLFFEQTHGYQLDRGEIISMPLEALYSPCSVHENWSTLTHEIGHSYYHRIGFKNKEEEIFEIVKKQIVKDKPNLIQSFWESMEDEVWELFAHWFDWRHIFNQDFDFLLLSFGMREKFRPSIGLIDMIQIKSWKMLRRL
ncbi:MAG: hypothetical protein KKA58_06430 [Nanoarchaeota archaeon]|nr:hypothetical protein [Nanoarchaeota archaeon]